jgi:DNA topoisomerase IB
MLGTKTAMAEVEKLPRPKNEAQYKKAVRVVADVVSKKLGNTPTVALQSYISPTVFAEWRAGIGQQAA